LQVTQASVVSRGGHKESYSILKLNQQDATLIKYSFIVSALHVSSGFSAHHQQLKNCTCSIGHLSNLYAVTTSLG